ncbi:mucinmucin-4-like [Octopus vulgaris]|uniref:Mucinmucin-4-like n=1 Tax=Octopus vulgaris TaxID=6645 RepID=A0AA36B147_OCTVU|nr:mucinmucin-4-like [Octopus vulgaris]
MNFPHHVVDEYENAGKLELVKVFVVAVIVVTELAADLVINCGLNQGVADPGSVAAVLRCCGGSRGGDGGGGAEIRHGCLFDIKTNVESRNVVIRRGRGGGGGDGFRMVYTRNTTTSSIVEDGFSTTINHLMTVVCKTICVTFTDGDGLETSVGVTGVPSENILSEINIFDLFVIDFNIFIAWMFGDPHIQTLDGLKYSFNGLGEYTLIRVHNKTTGINMLEIQARTAQAKNSNGTLINATIFSAFAMKDFLTNASAQVELASDEKTLVIYHKGIDKTSEFQSNSDYKLTDPALVITRKNDNKTDQSVSLTFTSGVDISVAVGIRMLTVTVSLPEGYKNTTATSGLMGVYNDDKNDDLTTPNGTVLPVNSNERDIFYNFGRLWAINTSLFKYPKGFSNADFTDTSFVPLFIDKTSAIYNKSLEICKADDNACIYDYIATGDESIAKATESLDKEAKDDFEAARNTAPEISGEKTVKININETATAILNVTDNEKDDITITKQQGGEYFNVSKNGSDITLSIYLMHSNAVNISIVANDVKNASSAEFVMSIVLCSGCSNHGNCREDNSENENFFLQSCDCNEEYAGDNCEKDFDGCSGDPCPGVGKCEDLKPEEHKAQNTSFRCDCPQGYVLNNATSRCLDINECNLNIHNCKQLCNDTEGSYTCDCYEGYSLQSNGSCTKHDVPKCDENHFGDKCERDCNICNEKSTERCDKVSGCICNEGWKGSTCETDIDECLNASVCSANEICENQNGTYECKCQKGYRKEENTCLDIDECQETSNSSCPQDCVNYAGDYECKCQSGYEGNGTTCEVIDKCLPLNCSDTCDVNNGTASCQCKKFYELDSTTNNTCIAIDKCSPNPCTNGTCQDETDSFKCVCEIGYKLANDKLTCNPCDTHTYGYNCNMTCGCVKGSCDPVKGCICNAGYTGVKCDTRIDFCAANIGSCDNKTSECVNGEQNYTCVCKAGYFKTGSGSCQKVRDRLRFDMCLQRIMRPYQWKLHRYSHNNTYAFYCNDYAGLSTHVFSFYSRIFNQLYDYKSDNKQSINRIFNRRPTN